MTVSGSRLRRGFTLVELLVVITIIGMLVGMLVPAVMSAMESARRTKCLNNVKNIVTALHSYESEMRKFPVNWGKVQTAGEPTAYGSTPSASSVYGNSWLTLLLPYMDEGNTYRLIDLVGRDSQNRPRALSYVQTDQGYDHPRVAQTTIKTFICPSDISDVPDQVLGIGYGVTNYKAVAGCNWTVDNWVSQGSTNSPAATNWPTGRSHGNKDGLDHGNGVICRGGSNTSFTGAPVVTTMADISDGASKTFAVGEALPKLCPWSSWYWFEGAVATCAIPLNYRLKDTPGSTDPTDWRITYGFRSRHNGGGNFAMCDGSGSFIPESIDLTVYRSLASINGREDASPPD